MIGPSNFLQRTCQRPRHQINLGQCTTATSKCTQFFVHMGGGSISDNAVKTHYMLQQYAFSIGLMISHANMERGLFLWKTCEGQITLCLDSIRLLLGISHSSRALKRSRSSASVYLSSKLSKAFLKKTNNISGDYTKIKPF